MTPLSQLSTPAYIGEWQFSAQTQQLPPSCSLFKSLILKSEIEGYAQRVCSAETSWEAQKKFKKLIIGAKGGVERGEEISCDLLCVEGGYRTSQGNWVMPRFREVASEEIDNYPKLAGVAFSTADLIQQLKPFQIPLSLCKIDELFCLAKNWIIPWDVMQDGCEGRAYLLYKLLIALGVSGKQVVKYYCYGDHLGKGITPEVNWSYHVALALCDEQQREWIIDPSVEATSPLLLREWISLLYGSRSQSLSFIPAGDLPFEYQEKGDYCIAICGDEYISSRNHSFKGKKISSGTFPSILNWLALYLTHFTVKRYPVLSAIVGKHLPSPYVRSIERYESEAIDRKIALKKIRRYSKGISPLPLNPDDIEALKPIDFYSCDKAKAVVANFCRGHYPLKFALKRLSQLLADDLCRAEKVIAQMAICYNRLKSEGFSESDLDIAIAALFKKSTQLRTSAENYISAIELLKWETIELSDKQSLTAPNKYPHFEGKL